MTNWKAYKFGQIAEIVMGQSPIGETCNEKGDGVPLLNGPTEFGSSFPSPVQFTTDPKKIAKPMDILFCVRGSTTGRMNWADQDYAIGRGLAAIRHRSGAQYRHFIKGLIEYNLDLLLQSATGSTFPNVSKDQLNDLAILAPDLDTQGSISEILSSLDDKIELNNQINKNLEALAQALFKRWFVDFEFPNENGQPYKSSGGEMVESELGMIPKGWRVGVLSEIIDFNPTERLPKGKKSSYIDMAALPTKGSWSNKPIQRIVGSGMKFRNGDTLFARITPCLENGKTAFIQCLKEGEIAWGSTEFIVLRPKQPWPEEFGYLIARDETFRNYAVQSMIGTSGRQRAQSQHLEKYPIVYPVDTRLLKLLDGFLGSFFEDIKSNSHENELLSELRDTILHKLISGELEVQNI